MEKSVLILGKNALIWVIHGLNFSFKMEFLRVSRRKNFFCNLVSLLLIFLTANKSLEGFGRVEVLSVFLNNCEASKRNEFFVLHGVSSIIALSKQYLFYTLSHFPVEPKFSKTRSCFFPTFDDILFFGWKKRKNENGWERMDFNVLTYTHEKCNIPFFPKIFLMRLRI